MYELRGYWVDKEVLLLLSFDKLCSCGFNDCLCEEI